MADTHITLFCLVDGESTSNAFPVKTSLSDTVGDLKKLIKIEKSPRFDYVVADELTLWSVEIPDEDDDIDDDAENLPAVLLDDISRKKKKKLKATHDLSDVFVVKPPKKTIHIIVKLSSPRSSDDLHPEVAALRKQLSEVLDSSINVGIVVKPDRKVVCKWSAVVDTVTIGDLKEVLVRYYPQYDHDDYLELLYYRTYTGESESIRYDEDLRRILRVAKTQSMTKLILSLNTPTKGFASWKFKDVCDEYGLAPGSTDPSLEDLPPFTGIEAVPLISDDKKKMLNQLIDEVGLRVDVLKLLGANESTKSMVIASFLLAATKLFKDDLYLAAQRDLSGRRGNGPLDFSVHSRKSYDYTLGVTEVKKEDFKQGVAQNIVQLESALTSRKRKRSSNDVDGGDEPPMEIKSYGIVTDASQWMLLECTLHVDETVSYKMTELERTVNYSGKWQDDVKFVFERLVWLWSRMRDEIPARERHRKSNSPPSDRQTVL
ncbi:hypothetical protein BGZ82_005760 [Podila clonocystis]|nr:hypothetical protein BGZ82_005760 [Podila clonocystis]